MRHAFTASEQVRQLLPKPDSSWPRLTLGELLSAKPSYGANASAIDYKYGVTPRFVRITDILSRDRLDPSSIVGIDPALATGSILKEGDVLIARTGNTVGKSFFYSEHHGLCAYAGYLIKFVFDTSICSLDYIKHILDSPQYWKWVRDMARTGAQPNINAEEYQSFPILVPPIDIQMQLAEILTCWDKAIELVERLIEEKRQLKRAWSQRLLIGKYHFGAENEGSKWKTLSAEEIFTVRSERKHGDKPVLSVTQDQGVVIRDSLDRRIAMTESDPNNFKLVKKGDFVISLRSFQGGLECSDIEGIVSPAYHVIYPKIPISRSYFRHLFKSYWFIGHLATAVIGIRDGKQISFQDFEFMELPFPPIEEQEKIGRFMDALDVEQSLLNKQLKALTDQKRGLMQKLLTGKIRVKV